MSYISLKENLVFNALTQGVNALLPLLIQYLIVRRLDLVDIASLNVLFSMQALFALVGAAGNLHLLTVTSLQPVDYDSMMVTNGTVFGVLCAIPSAVLFVFFALGSDGPNSSISGSAVIFAVAFSILVAPLAGSFYFQARLLNRQMFAIRVISRVVLLIGTLLFVKQPDDAVTYGIFYSLVMVLEYLLAYTRVHRLIDLRTASLTLQMNILYGSIKYLHFNLTYGVLPHYAVVIGFGRVEAESFAEFSVVIKIVNLVTGFITSSVMVLYPFKNSHIQKPGDAQFDTRALLWTCFISILAAIGLIFFSKQVYLLVLNRPDPVIADEFWLLTLYIPIHAIFNYYIFNFFIFQSRHKFVLILNSLVLFAFCLILIVNQILSWQLSLTSMLISTSTAALVIAFIYKTFFIDRWRMS